MNRRDFLKIVGGAAAGVMVPEAAQAEIAATDVVGGRLELVPVDASKPASVVITTLGPEQAACCCTDTCSACDAVGDTIWWGMA